MIKLILCTPPHKKLYPHILQKVEIISVMKILKLNTGDKEYAELLDEVLESIVEIYGRNTCVQFEDLHNRNGFRFLERYSKDYVVFNDGREKLVSEIAEYRTEKKAEEKL